MSQAIKERPIIFSAESVRAIIDGRKTQTRRVVKFPGGIAHRELVQVDYARDGRPIFWGDASPVSKAIKDSDYYDRGMPCPYGVPDDRLWVKESFEAAYRRTKTNNGCVYRADYHPTLGRIDLDRTLYHDKRRWKSPLFMPRWASRLTLEVVSVRVERLQEITLDDACDEGVFYDGAKPDGVHPYPIATFKHVWDSINAKRGYPWASNPWVWVIEFKNLSANSAPPREA